MLAQNAPLVRRHIFIGAVRKDGKDGATKTAKTVERFDCGPTAARTSVPTSARSRAGLRIAAAFLFCSHVVVIPHARR
jgi:hypothetical protein